MTTDNLGRHLGAAIRNYRETAGLSQTGLATEARVGQSRLSDIENGQHTPSLAALERIAAALGTRPWVLLRDADQLAHDARAASDG